MSMRTRREYGLPWPWHLLRAPHPPRPVQVSLVVARPRKILGRTPSLKASAMPELARWDQIETEAG